jgi:hypothetical protein
MPLLYPERWGPLKAKYEIDRPRKMLALDGGGIRGLITLGILESVEDQLRLKVAKGKLDFRLCDYFDYIAGTSTGAIIAAGLASGKSVAELIRFYEETGNQMFEKEFLLARLKSLYKADPLRTKLQQVFGADTTLEPQHMKCLLLVVNRNATTDSPRPVSSNPDAKYNDPNRKNNNLRIPLWQLVRASTAAPVYFPPEVLEWDPTDPKQSFVFVDGGVTPYNNPAFLLYRMATAAPYRLNWKTGESNLLLISIGTGACANPGAGIERPDTNLFSNVAGLPGHLMYAIQVEQDINCRVVGRCSFGAPIDSELLDLAPRDLASAFTEEEIGQAPVIPISRDLSRAFLYARYNADLSQKGLDALNIGKLAAEKVQKLDAVANIPDLLTIGRAVGKEQVKLDHFGTFA